MSTTSRAVRLAARSTSSPMGHIVLAQQVSDNRTMQNKVTLGPLLGYHAINQQLAGTLQQFDKLC